jgi:Tfp pilus assembly protein PilV
MKALQKYQHGQSLLELVVAIGVVAVIVTGLVNAVTSSLRFGQASRDRSQAVKLAQEGIELARSERDSSIWTDFLTFSGADTETWCLNESGSWSLAPSDNNCPVTPQSRFWRYVTFDWNDPIMEVNSEVSWGDRSETNTVFFETFLSERQ